MSILKDYFVISYDGYDTVEGYIEACEDHGVGTYTIAEITYNFEDDIGGTPALTKVFSYTVEE